MLTDTVTVSAAGAVTGPAGVIENAPLQDKNTFHVKAQSRWFGFFKTAEDLKALFADTRFKDVPKFVLGGGSNLLLTDNYPGLRLQGADGSAEVVDENDGYWFVRVGAGADWTRFVDMTLEAGMQGLENLALIPGTAGGAVVQNLGAYGLEIAERVSDVECFDPATGEPLTLTADDCDYGYRTSVFKTKRPDLIVLSVTLALPKTFEPRTAYKELAAVFGERVPADANELAEAVKSVRRKKLPDPKVLGNAGSFFKNPVVTKVKMVHLLEDDPTLVAYPLAGGRAKLAAGRALQCAATELTGYIPPWGILTGVRPARGASALLDSGKTPAECAAYLTSVYGASDDKSSLAVSVAESERRFILPDENGRCSIYIAIPYSPTK